MPDPINVLLCDLDGVVRLFPAGHRDGCEDRHGLERGVLARTAFASPLLDHAITGILTRHEWTIAIGEAVGSPAAASEWLAERGAAAPDMLALVDQVRSAGCRVAILTNGTDTVHEELANLGITSHFDAVFSTWDIGYAKPDVRAFQHVVEALGCDPGRMLFTDDSKHKLAGATDLGMRTHHYRHVAGLRNALADIGGLSLS